jgi:hypothetical protein
LRYIDDYLLTRELYTLPANAASFLRPPVQIRADDVGTMEQEIEERSLKIDSIKRSVMLKDFLNLVERKTKR